jgi:glycosyltransferase involved in cell wall biosynthesis
MKILVTCDRYPSLPLDGLTLRIHHYARYLSQNHQLDLVCLGEDISRNDQIEAYFDKVHVFPYPRKAVAKGLIAKLRNGLSPRRLYPVSSDVIAHLEKLAESRRYDLVWDAGCNMLFNLHPLAASTALLADQVDDGFLRMRREIELAPTLYKKVWTMKQFALTWLFSVFYVRSAQAVLFVSETDAKSFRRAVPFSNVAVVENGVDETFFTPDPSAHAMQGDELVFEGSMSFGPNVDAAEYFVDSILPLIKRQLPNVHLTIVGRDPSDAVLALSSDDVEVTGSVPDIRPYLRKAAVFVCPMRGGAGIKNKILQAWAMGKAVVSTTAGVGSLKVSDGQNILVRDAPLDLANAVVELLRNPAKASQLGDGGRSTIEAHYTWAAKARELEALMEQIANRHSPDERRSLWSR